jgi:hypothetical protein
VSGRPTTAKLSDFDRAALKVRHQAAIEALNSPTAPEGWRLLAAVVAPSEAVKLASERRARELLEKTAAG